MGERWVEVFGFPNYEISSEGRVRHRITKNIRKLLITGRGYKSLSLTKNGVHSGQQCVHVLVLSSFVCPRPDGMQAAHNDGDRLNNKLSNLRWASAKENAIDRINHGTQVRGSRSHLSKLTDGDVAYIREKKLVLGKNFKTDEFAKKFNVCSQTIWKILNGKTYSNVKARAFQEGDR